MEEIENRLDPRVASKDLVRLISHFARSSILFTQLATRALLSCSGNRSLVGLALLCRNFPARITMMDFPAHHTQSRSDLVAPNASARRIVVDLGMALSVRKFCHPMCTFVHAFCLRELMCLALTRLPIGHYSR
jgi:hypothetical protein